MNYSKFCASLAVACVLIATSALAVAKKGVPPGQAKKNSSQVSSGQPTSAPPGWQHGKKTGWHGGKYPPGWSKWNKKKQTNWINDRDHAYDEIVLISTRYKISEPKQNEITQAFGEAIAGGLLINDAKDKLIGALKNKDSRKALMIDTTQSVLELLK